MYISTHALTEGDSDLSQASNADIAFQLTPSRRATTQGEESSNTYEYFNSRPHGGRHIFGHFNPTLLSFQLTPSRRATAGTPCTCPTVLFQLTPSRRATMLLLEDFLRDLISTHALTEGDAGRTG